MKPLSVLAAARSLPFHGIGGMQAIAWDVLTGLALRGHRVTVLTTSIPGSGDVPFENTGVRVVPLAGTTPGRYSASWWRTSRRYARQHLAGTADAVLSVSSAAAGLLALKGAELAAPFLFQAHGSSWAEALSKWRSGRPVDLIKSVRNVYWIVKDAGLYRSFDQIVFVGAALQRQFEQAPLRWMTRGIARATISNGVDTDRFRFDPAQRALIRSRFGFGEADRVLVFSARLHPHKGAAESVRALAALRRQGTAFKLLLIGEGSERAGLHSLAHELDCADAIAFAGAVRREEVPGLLSAGNAFVFPALGREGLPLNVLEALAVGLPAICADTLREVFGDLRHITYAAARSPARMAAAIQQAALRGAPGASLLPEEFSLRHCVDAYEALMRRRLEH